MFLTYDSEKSDEFSGKLQQPDSQRFFLNDLYRLRVLWITATAAPDHHDEQKKKKFLNLKYSHVYHLFCGTLFI